MKRISLIICASLALLLMSSTASSARDRNVRNDVMINLEQLDQDAAMRQFSKARKDNQLEIIRYLIDEANKKFYECKTEEDLDKLLERLSLITWYHNQAKAKSIYNTSSINELAKKIEKVKREITGGNTVIIDSGVGRDSYRFNNAY